MLAVTEDEDTIRFVDQCGTSFTRYEGTWRVLPKDGGTAVSYELTARPAFDVPEFILKRLLKRDSGQMIRAACGERSPHGRPVKGSGGGRWRDLDYSPLHGEISRTGDRGSEAVEARTAGADGTRLAGGSVRYHYDCFHSPCALRG